jgi:hypothetical protein
MMGRLSWLTPGQGEALQAVQSFSADHSIRLNWLLTPLNIGKIVTHAAVSERTACMSRVFTRVVNRVDNL